MALKVEASPAARTRMGRQQRRAEIFANALRIIGEQGYRAFSLGALAKQCGLTNAGLLHHFGSKEELLIALLQDRDRQDEAAVAAMLEPYEAHPLSAEACRATCRAIVLRNAGQPEMIRLYAMLRVEALSRDHPAYGFFLQRETATIELFRQMVAMLVPDPLSTARQIDAMMNGLEVQWLRQDCRFDLVAEWDKAAVGILP